MDTQTDDLYECIMENNMYFSIKYFSIFLQFL